jgi:PAS domain S-box-containing protein
MARRSPDRSSTSADGGEYDGASVPVVAQPQVSEIPGEVTMNGLAPNGDQQQGLVTLEEETRRRLEAESTLGDSEARYRLLYENNPSMYFTLSPTGTVVSVNRFGATQLGYQPEELIGQSILKVFKPDEHQAVLDQLTVCAATPMKVFQWEIQKVRKDGSTLWVKERAQAVVDHTGQILALVVCEDITERRLTEECMRESEERWRALFEHAGVGIAQLGLNGQFLRVNPHLCETLGYSSKTMMRHTLQDFFHPEDRPLNLEHLDQLIAGKRPSFSTEIRYRRCDDAWLWVEMNVSLVRDGISAPAYLIAVVQNIDDRKQAEAERRHSERALQEQEALLRSVIETATDAIFMKDRHGRYRFINTAGALVIGRSCEEIVGKTDTELLPPETAEHIMADDQHVLWEGVQKRQFETLFPGEARVQTFYTVKTPHTDQLGNIVGLVGIARDMTDLKRAETELRNSEERFRLMFENAPVGMVIVSQEKILKKINPAFQRLVGYSEKEIVGHTYAFYTHPDDLQQNLLVTEQFLRGEIASYALEKRYVRKDGEVIWVNVNVSPLRLPGEPDRMLLAIVEDITDRKRAESALALTQFAVNHAGDLIFWIGRDSRILYVNEAAAQRLGYSREELCHMTIGDVDPNYQPDVWPRHWEELRLHKKLRFESCYRTRTGVLYPAEIVSTYVSFEGQEYNFTFTRDISERKAAEEALRASEERFSKAFRSSPYPIGITDLDTGACLDINDAALAVFGFTREEVIGHTTFSLGIWPNAGARRQFIEHVKKNGSVRNVEVPLKSKQGDARRFLASTEVIELNGKHCLVTIGTDITEQKRAEEALRRSELAVRQAFEERDRLSQDLHDNLLQSLYAVGMGLELTKHRIQRISRTNAKRLEQSVGQLNHVIREVRSFISQTQAPAIFEQTVADALRALAGSFMATGAGDVAVRIDDEGSIRLSQEQRNHILAIAKEALSNSIRHTKADTRVVTLRRQGNKIRLEITDNGQGFLPTHRRTQGMGLQNMRARARKLRGRIAITSALRKGTTVTLTIPLT